MREHAGKQDPDLRQLPNLSSMEIAALRSC
jgi:hypothetical protein